MSLTEGITPYVTIALEVLGFVGALSVLGYFMYKYLSRTQHSILIDPKDSFPLLTYDMLPKQYPHKACSKCRRSFKPQDECRQLPCYHLIHEGCFEAWHDNSDDCPSCHQNMDPESLAYRRKSHGDVAPAMDFQSWKEPKSDYALSGRQTNVEEQEPRSIELPEMEIKSYKDDSIEYNTAPHRTIAPQAPENFALEAFYRHHY